jgi:hypothetical protein
MSFECFLKRPFPAMVTLLSGLWLLLPACTADQLPEPAGPDCSDLGAPTYLTDIKPVIDQSCAYSGCHLDSAPGNFSDYDGLLPFLESNDFRQRVILERADAERGMPPDFAPDDRPRDLSDEQIRLIECWLASGYPEQ